MVMMKIFLSLSLLSKSWTRASARPGKLLNKEIKLFWCKAGVATGDIFFV